MKTRTLSVALAATAVAACGSAAQAATDTIPKAQLIKRGDRSAPPATAT